MDGKQEHCCSAYVIFTAQGNYVAVAGIARSRVRALDVRMEPAPFPGLRS